METMISFGQLAAVLKGYGPFGMLVVVWFFDIRQLRAMAGQYRDDMRRSMAEHKAYMEELRRMYENNVQLVEGYEDLTKDLKDLIIMNTQGFTHLQDDIRQNQYCPASRITKETHKVVVR